MKVSLEKSKLTGSIDAISSKSIAHRIIICSALSQGARTKIMNMTPSSDVYATLSAVSTLGAVVDASQNSIIAPTKYHDGLIDVNECGSTLRFMLPISAAIGGEYVFVMRGKLKDRPMDELLKVLEEHSISVTKTSFIKLKGKLTAGKYSIRGDISSQYVSGLLMALPLLDGDSEIVLTTPLSSKDYVEITLNIMEEYGVSVVKKDNSYFIKGNQKYKSPKTISVEGDWSNSAFWIVAGVINGNITVKNLKKDSLQGDKRIVDIIKNMGGDVTIKEDVVVAKKSQLMCVDVDVDDIPDAVPALAVCAAYAEGVSVFRNIGRLKLKESDRVFSIIDMLNSANIYAYERDNNLYVQGGEVMIGDIKSHFDHRIAMSGSILLLNTGGSILDAQSVNKSYPNFFIDLQKLGGNTYVQV